MMTIALLVEEVVVMIMLRRTTSAWIVYGTGWIHQPSLKKKNGEQLKPVPHQSKADSG